MATPPSGLSRGFLNRSPATSTTSADQTESRMYTASEDALTDLIQEGRGPTLSQIQDGMAVVNEILNSPEPRTPAGQSILPPHRLLPTPSPLSNQPATPMSDMSVTASDQEGSEDAEDEEPEIDSPPVTVPYDLPGAGMRMPLHLVQRLDEVRLALGESPLVDPSELTLIGPYTISTTHGPVTIAPYAQYIFKLMDTYYSDTTLEGWSDVTFKLLYYVAACHRGPAPANFTQRIQNLYTYLDNEGLLLPACILGTIFFSATDLANNTNVSGFTYEGGQAAVLRLTEQYRQAAQTYSVFVSLCDIGSTAITPIPEFIQYNPSLSDFFDAICRGLQPAASLRVNLTTRVSARRRLESMSQSPPAIRERGESSTSQLPRPQPRMDTPRPPPRQQQIPGMRRTVPQAPINAGPQRPPTTTQGPSLLPQTTIPPQAPVRSENELREQGRPTHPPTVRDTTAFRNNVMEFSALTQGVEQLRTDLLTVRSTVETILTRLSEQNAQIDSIARSMVILTAQRSLADMGEAVNINQTLLPRAPPIPGQPQPTPRVMTPQPVNIAQDLINCLSGYTPDMAPALAARLREFLEQAGRGPLALAVSESTLAEAGYRTRMIRIVRDLGSVVRPPTQ